LLQDWLPFNESAIHIRDFSSPKVLAEYITMLDKDEEKYQQHLKHKSSSRSDLNRDLLRNLESRTWSVGERLWNNFEAKTLVEEYECFVCRKLHSKLEDGQWVVSKEHYDCPVPTSPLKTELKNSFWFDQWHQGKFEAEVLRELLYTNITVSQEEFHEKVGSKMIQELKNSRFA